MRHYHLSLSILVSCMIPTKLAHTYGWAKKKPPNLIRYRIFTTVTNEFM